MNTFVKRLRNICVTLILMMGVYEYAKTTGIYQVEDINTETAVQESSVDNENERKPNNGINLKEVPERGDDVDCDWRYFAYKDLLILEYGRVYKKQDGMYQLTDQTLSDMTGIENENISVWYKQCRNLLIAEAKDMTAFLVYDMETDLTYSCPVEKGREIGAWYIQDGEIYYTEWILNDDGRKSCDNAIRKMNPENGESVEYYRSENPELDFFWFYIRKDGTIFCECGGADAGRWVYWKIQQDADRKWTETKLCEVNRWKYRGVKELNEYGLLVNGQLFDGAKIESVVIKDNGDIEPITLLGEQPRVYLDNGYLVRGKAWQEGYVTFYDYAVNAVNTYRLIDEDYIEKGYKLENLIYCDNIITGLYVQEDTQELYVAQIRAEIEQEAEAEPEQTLPDNVIDAYVTEDIEYVDEVIPAQYTDNLSLLADMKYTNSVYVYQDGKVYYRRYNEDSHENAALWGNYDSHPIPETKKEIVCVDADGVETVLFEDEGYGDIYLVNNRFYMMDEKLCEEDGSTHRERHLYSVDMQGNDRIDYGNGKILAVDKERNIIILQVYEDDDTNYYIMNYETGEKKRLFPDSVDCSAIYISDYQDGWIYYDKSDYDYSPDYPVSKLCAASIEGEQREIIGITSSYTYPESIGRIEVDEERAYFIFGGYAGSGVDFQGGLLISVKLDGTDYKAVWTEDDTFYLCHDKGKALVYFPRHYNGLFGGDDRPEYDALVWDVEADICYRSDFPTNVLYYYDIRTGLMWRYCSADMGALCSITISDDELQRKKTDVYAITDDSGKIVKVVMDIEKYITKWEAEEVDLIKYKDFYFADGILYFKVEYSAYDEETTIGWRDGYRRLRTNVYRLKIGEDKAEVLYSY